MAKRAFDLIVALVAMILLLPAFAVIGVAVKLDGPGPIFYRATRVGKNGRLFGMYKFRTMKDGPAGAGPRVTAHDDPRITPLGALLRRTKLNELPQLLNVLKGEMSLVGPRPEDPDFVAHYSPEERQVLSVTPGMTSPAAILYAGEEGMLNYASAAESYLSSILPTKLRLDLLYVRHRSLLLDLDVLLRTFLAFIPTLGRAVPDSEAIFLGPVQRLVRRYFSWFVVDLLTALVAVGLAGLIWRATGPLDLGWGRGILVAFGLALAFSLANWLRGMQRTAWRYAGLEEASDVALSTALATGLLVAGNAIVLPSPLLPGGMLVLAGFLALTGFVVVRYHRTILAGLSHRLARPQRRIGRWRERVLLVGGGEAGQLMLWILQNAAGGQAFKVVGIVDDDLWKRGVRIHGVSVLGDRRRIADLVRTHDVGLIVFAIHNIAPSEQQAILEVCRATPARVVIMPDIVALLNRLARPGPEEAQARSGPVGWARPAAEPGVGGMPPLSPPVKIVDHSGPHIETQVVSALMTDLARLAAEGRTNDICHRLDEFQSLLD